MIIGASNTVQTQISFSQFFKVLIFFQTQGFNWLFSILLPFAFSDEKPANAGLLWGVECCGGALCDMRWWGLANRESHRESWSSMVGYVS